MIVVCGDFGRRAPRATFASAVAGSAAAAGSAVQAVGVVPDDPEGDRCLLDLVAAGVGHAAVLRGPARNLDAADVDLALRYLSDTRVVVAVGLAPAAAAAAAERTRWAGATLVAIREPGAGAEAGSDALLDGAIVLEAPTVDPEGAFAGFIGDLAVRIDGGATPADAWTATTQALAVDTA